MNQHQEEMFILESMLASNSKDYEKIDNYTMSHNSDIYFIGSKDF